METLWETFAETFFYTFSFLLNKVYELYLISLPHKLSVFSHAAMYKPLNMKKGFLTRKLAGLALAGRPGRSHLSGRERKMRISGLTKYADIVWAVGEHAWIIISNSGTFPCENTERKGGHPAGGSGKTQLGRQQQDVLPCSYTSNWSSEVQYH